MFLPTFSYLFYTFLVLGFQWIALILGDVWILGGILELGISVRWDNHFRTDLCARHWHGTGARVPRHPGPQNSSPWGKATVSVWGVLGLRCLEDR